MRRAILTLLTLGAIGLSFAACADQPPVQCTIASGDLSAKFYPISAEGDCDPMPGDVFGVTAYVPNPTNPGNGLSKLAIQSQTLGEARDTGEAADPPVVDADPNDMAYAIGEFDSVTPGEGNVCRVSHLAPARLRLADPPTDLTYDWSEIRVLVDAAQIGVQMTGELTLTQNGCVRKYHVTGLYPSVPCAALDDAGAPLTDAAGNPVLDPSQCSPDNGLNPNVSVTCDPVLALCVPADEHPF